MRRGLRPNLQLELTPSALPRHIAYHAMRWGMLVGLALLTYVFYQVPRGVDVPVLEVGEVATREILAPFAYPVKKSRTEFEREANALAATVPPIYVHRPAAADTALRDADSLFAAQRAAGSPQAIQAAAQRFGVRLTPEEAQYLTVRRLAAFERAVKNHIRTRLARGVPAPQSLQLEQIREILVQRDGRERAVRPDSVLTYQRYLDQREVAHPDPNSPIGDLVLVKLLNGLFRPTLVPNTAETERRRNVLRASVDSVKDSVRADERIIDANEVVTADVRDRLLSLRSELAQRGGAATQDFSAVAGQMLSNVLILAVFWLLLMLYRRETYGDLRHIGVLAVLLGLVIIGSWLNRRLIADVPEFIPIPFAAVMITVLFGGRVAMVAAMVLAVLLGTQAVYGGLDALFIALVGGVTAAVSVRQIRRRNQVLMSFAWVTLAYLVAALAVGLRHGQSLVEIGSSGLLGGVNAFISAALVLISLPLFESFARATTDLTLLELSDPSRPLLRRLATEAPGTYAHSIAMANLCEAACNAIGANGLLARVGCYYHDVGKVKKPQYFVENQVPGVNPHDKLKPDVSASIIRNHVKDGLVLADEHNLPAAVQAFIPEHHGTMEITYFLDRARQRTSDPEINPAEYRYPGPRPRSVETAVTMLADGVEAALRVLDDPTAQKLSDAIDHICTKRIEAGQLDEAPLTMAQLTQVKTEFMRVLGSVYHSRIDYPASSGGIGAEWEARAGA